VVHGRQRAAEIDAPVVAVIYPLRAALIANKADLTSVLASPETSASDAAAASKSLSWFEHRSFHQ
jgi:hypothetical protein